MTPKSIALMILYYSYINSQLYITSDPDFRVRKNSCFHIRFGDLWQRNTDNYVIFIDTVGIEMKKTEKQN